MKNTWRPAAATFFGRGEATPWVFDLTTSESKTVAVAPWDPITHRLCRALPAKSTKFVNVPKGLTEVENSKQKHTTQCQKSLNIRWLIFNFLSIWKERWDIWDFFFNLGEDSWLVSYIFIYPGWGTHVGQTTAGTRNTFLTFHDTNTQTLQTIKQKQQHYQHESTWQVRSAQ